MHRAIDDTVATLHANGAAVTWTLNNHDTQRAVTRYGRADATDPASWTGSNLVYSAARRRRRASGTPARARGDRAGGRAARFAVRLRRRGARAARGARPGPPRRAPIRSSCAPTGARSVATAVASRCRGARDPATAYGFSAGRRRHRGCPSRTTGRTWAVSTRGGRPDVDARRCTARCCASGARSSTTATTSSGCCGTTGGSWPSAVAAVTVVLNPTDAAVPRCPTGWPARSWCCPRTCGLAWTGEVPPDTAVWLR